ncbi:MAG: glycosyltransferase [Desulfobacteraceae bacterium]|nr:glycosyltransferase [Desulfobacteraceae bacterium]MBC2749885.1 glycosyltransferase [Desulfobacteraceae bacterium]
MNHCRESPRVSVIIPTYNRSWCLSEAIDSVLSQTFQNIELIVVDDGSTDETPALLSHYGDHLRVLRQSNRGVSAARNGGIQAARGNLIAFLDSDDTWQPGKLARQVDFFDTHPDAMICQTEETWIRRGVRVNPKRRHRKLSGWIFEASLALCLVSPSAVMMRRELLEGMGGFDESLPACEDYDLWLRVSLRYPIHLIDDALVVKRGGHEDQLSRQHSLDRYRIQSLVKIIGSEPLTDDQTRAASAMLREKCRIYAAGCRKHGRIEDAKEYEALNKPDPA